MFILEAALLSGVLGIGYGSYRRQKRKYSQELRRRQQLRTAQLRRSAHEAADQNSPAEPGAKRALARTRTDLSLLGGAIGFSCVGHLIYAPAGFIAAPMVLYAARKRIVKAARDLRHGRLDVESLSAASIIGAVFSQRFFVASLLGFINAIGDQLSAKVVRESHHDLVDVFTELPKSVWLWKDGVEIQCPLSEIGQGDLLAVGAGEIVPVDGRIVSGVAAIDEHRLTGESMPVEKGPGAEIFAMTMVLSGSIRLEVERAGTDTVAMEIAQVLNRTADYRSSTVLEAEAMARQLVKPAFLVSGLLLPVLGFSAAVGVLVAHPKERLKVSAPISLMSYLRRSMREGVLIKDGRSLELLAKVDTVVFDKTGTLTEEQPHVGEVHLLADLDTDAVLCCAAAAERKQPHPVAAAIIQAATDRGLDPPQPEQIECRVGYGIKARVSGADVRVGSLRFLSGEGIAVATSTAELVETCRARGHGIVAVAVGDVLVAVIELLPSVRPEAAEAIRALKRAGRITRTYIISGDHEAPTAALAEALGIDGYFAQTLPQAKAALIEKLQAEGRCICFIGDGINDAVAMKQAEVSVSLNGASRLATDTAEILLLDSGIAHLPRLFELAYRFNRHMQAQFAMILGPSAFGLSMIVLAGWGISAMMTLNMLGLATTLGYSLLQLPPTDAQASPVSAGPARQPSHRQAMLRARPLHARRQSLFRRWLRRPTKRADLLKQPRRVT